MRILVVSGMFPPIRTGTAFYARNLAIALNARGHDITVVALGAGIPPEDGDALPSRISLHRLPAKTLPMAGFFKHFQLCAWNPRTWWRLRHIAKDSKADVVLLVNHYLDIAFPTIYAARSLRVPLVCSVGTQLQSLNPWRDRILNVLDRAICGRLIFPFCTKLIAWDSQIQAYLEDVQGSRIKQKIRIVNYGVNGDMQALANAPHRYGDAHTILGVGAISEQRSFVPLVQAFAKIADRFPNLTLRIIGHVYYDAAQRFVVENGLESRVSFLGEQPHEIVLKEMQAADLFYSSLTGKYVGLGTATIEAMLLGVPTMANVPLDLLGRHMLEDDVHLFQETSFDPHQIAERLTEALSDAELRATVGEGGRRFVRDNMNWNVVAQDMEDTLRELCQ